MRASLRNAACYFPSDDLPAKFVGNHGGDFIGGIHVGRHQCRIETALLVTVSPQFR